MELKAQLEKEAVSYKRQHMVREACYLSEHSLFHLGRPGERFGMRNVSVWVNIAACKHGGVLDCRYGGSARQPTAPRSCQTWPRSGETPGQRWKHRHMRCTWRAPWPLRGSAGRLPSPSCCAPSEPHPCTRTALHTVILGHCAPKRPSGTMLFFGLSSVVHLRALETASRLQEAMERHLSPW